MKKWKQWIGMAVCTLAAVVIAGCGADKADGASGASQKGDGQVELTVYAAASMTETMKTIAAEYEKSHPNIKITYNFDSSGTLKKQIENGANCDIFISAAQKQMNQLDASQDAEKNPKKLDFINTATRVNLLENKVVLVAPEGNPKGVKSFADMAKDLTDGSIRLVIGNSDVPVGQYSQRILTYLGLDETALAAEGRISYGSNVKEVTTQVVEHSADCGIIYETDAFSAGLTPLDWATKDMCGQVIYPAAVMKNSAHEKEAKEFLAYLQGPEAMEVFKGVGFSSAP